MSDAGRMRLDLWLWRARFFKSRGQASEAVTSRGARIMRDELVRRVNKGASEVEVGDLISFSNAAGTHVVEIVGLPIRRGSAKEAAGAYRRVETAPSGSTEGAAG